MHVSTHARACSPQCLVVQVQKIPVRRQIWPFGSRLGLSEISHWQACYRISSKITGQICFRSWSECSPQCLAVQVPKQHGRRQPSLSFLVIASPQKLRDWFKWHLPIRLASMSSCAIIKPNSGRSTNFTFLTPSSDLVKRSIRHLVFASPLEPLKLPDLRHTFSHLWQLHLTFTFERICHMWRIRTYFAHMWKIRTNSSRVWQISVNSSHV